MTQPAPITRTLALVCLVALCAAAAPAAEMETLDRDEQRAVLTRFVELMDELYLFPDRIDEITGPMTETLESGEYDGMTPPAFARRLTDDLREISGDLHFSVRHDPEQAARIFAMAQAEDDEGTSPGPRGALDFESGSPEFRRLLERYKVDNFSMPRVEVLPGNIGYLRFEAMPPLAVAKPTLDAAMTFLRYTDALVLDVRQAPGGVGGFITYLMSYFFAEQDKLLYTRYFGADDRSELYTTHAEIGGARRPEMPLFVLTSGSTGSAAENLAFTLKHHGRATIVGETTIGAGHSAGMTALDERFLASVPMATVLHPETGSGFEGVGVVPDIEVAAEDALAEARGLALERLLASAEGRQASVLEAALAALRTEQAIDAGEGAEEAWTEYIGEYGGRSVSVIDGKLRYQRRGGPALGLDRIDGDLFRLALPPGMRARNPVPDVRFERDDEGRITGFSLVASNGSVEEYAAKGSASE